MKKYNQIIFLFLFSFSVIQAQTKETKDAKPTYEVTNLQGINSVNSDFGVTEFGNSILFSSVVEKKVFMRRIDKRSKRNFLDIYQVKKENISPRQSDISNVKLLFSKDIKSKLNESSVTFSPDYKTIYFTRNNYVNKKFIVDKKGYNNLKILKAEWIGEKWDNIVELPFCSTNYSVGHPSLSKDGKQLYFISDMPGGIGKTDIYTVAINNDGTYGSIQNLGTPVNTAEKEMFPFISADNMLYFSSDGHFGMGALDIFSTKKIAGTYTKPINLKAPVNTKQDDFSFSINTVTKKGYLSSNRDGGAGQDDIYAVQQLPPKKACAATITGIVQESKFKQHLPFSKIIIKDNFGTTIKDIITDEEGRFSFKLPCNQQFVIIGSKEYYTSEVKSFKTSEKNLKVDLLLEIVADFGYNMDTELVIKTNPLYFNFNKWNISVNAEIELDYIVNIMTKYPKIILAGVSGTDARGSSFDNKILSQKRTKSVVNYLIDKGISSDRIYGKGDGESKLTNKCVDNDSHSNRVKCLEVEHQANRRTYFMVLNVDGKIINSEAKKLLPAAEIIKNSSNIKRL